MSQLEELNKLVDTPELDVVRIIITNNNDEVLLVVEFDDPEWKLPGGKIHEGETIIAAIERESMEELGIKVSADMIYTYTKANIPNSENFRHIVRANLGELAPELTKETAKQEYFAQDNIPRGKFFEHITSALSLTKNP